MNAMEMLNLGIGVALLLYVAYKLGKFVIKVVLGWRLLPWWSAWLGIISALRATAQPSSRE